jgi:hypothetical protein
MSKFLSGRQSNLKLGISGYTESKTVLQTTGKVGIGTTDAQNFSLFVVGDSNISGIVSATSFYGDGSNLENTGATLASAAGTQRLVVTSLTSGTMVDAATDSDLTFNATTNTLNTDNLIVAGNLTVSGDQTILNTTSLEVEDINIGIASANPKLNDAQLDGAGITIYGNAGDKSLTWNNTNSRMEFNTDLYAPNLQVGTGVTIYGNAGIVSATAFYGDGSNLQNTGATLSATSGTERLVTTQLTSGTMVNASTDVDLTFNATDNLLHTPKIDVAGLSPDGTTFGASGYVPLADGAGGWNWANLQGASSVNTILNGFTVSEEGVVVGTAGSITQLDFRGVNVLASADPQPNGIATVTIALNQSLDSIDVGGISTFRGLVGNGVTFGSQGQYLEATGIGITWKNFPTLRTTQTNTATAGQTAFNFTYNIDFLDVFVNGVKLSSSEYTATNGNQVVLDTPAFVGETVEFHSYNVTSTYGGGGGGGGASNLDGLTDVTIGTLADNQLLQYNSSSGEWENISAATVVGAASSFATKSATATTATNNQTTFNGTYTVGFVDVFLNGVKQSEDEYTATSGTNIVLSTGASEGDLIEVVGLTANVPGSGGGGSYANSDVDTHLNTSTASTGEVLSWNGSDYDWVAQSGGGGGGGISLTDLSVTTNSVGTAALAYNNSNGVFSYTPPDLSSFATTTALNTAVSNSSNWDTAYGWGNHASAGYLTAETDTLASVTGRGSSTNVDLTFSGNLSASGISTLSNVTVGGASTEMVVDGDLRVTGIITTGTGSVTIDGTTNEIIVGTGVTIYGNTGIISATKVASHSLQFTDNNVTIAGTSGTAGQFKQIGGAPFYYDGTAWREIVLSDGTPVTTSADTDWDNVLIRLDFEQASNNISLIENKKVLATGQDQNADNTVSTTVDLTGSPVKFGSKALRFDGSAGGTMPFAWINRIDNTNDRLMSFEGAFTIELWIYLSELPGTGECFPILSQSEIAASPDDDWSFNITRDGSSTNYNINWYNENHSDGNVYNGYGKRIGLLGGTSLLNQWNHVALVREAGDSSMHLYWNGTESGYTSGSVDALIDTTVNDAAISDYISFGYHYQLNNTQRWFTGVMDDVRISKSARYTSNFTAPTSALPISGSSTTTYTPPGSKQGEITLGNTPTWTGTTGVTASRQSSGHYRLTFASAFASNTAYTVNANAMDYDPATSIVGVGVSRVSSSACDFFVSRMSDSALVDTGSLAISVYKK